jgi:very-short-patch-repair endonuclease
MAENQDGVFGANDAARVGVGADELLTLTRRGALVRVRRGAYVLAEGYAAAEPSGRYLLRAEAILRTRGDADRLSHQSALAFLGIAAFDVDHALVAVETRQASRRRVHAGLAVHPWTGGDTWTLGAFRSVSPAVACVQVARVDGFMAGLAAMDSALHRSLCSLADLESSARALAGPKVGTVERVIAACDPSSESVGETRTRIILVDGNVPFASQVDIADSSGFIGRVDFLVDGCVVVEFDGMIKYAGQAGQAALAREKIREDRLRRAGYEVVRIVWSELDDPAAILRRIDQARRLARERRAAGLRTSRGA